MVYVIAKDGTPLSPTENHAKVRVLLKTGRAKVFRREPFVIKLLFDTEHNTPECIHGMDTGSFHIGSSIYMDEKIVYTSKIELRNDIKDAMDIRRMYRHNRRNRKTRYRKPRFLNRKSSKRKGRLPPTLMHKIAVHEREMSFVRKILPISKTVIEAGNFDPHLLKDPALAFYPYRQWGYQQGELYGWYNKRAYVLARDGYECQCCKGRHKDPKLEIHHIVFRSEGGSDEPNNLVTLCHTCHKKLHDGKLPDFDPQGFVKGTLKHATQMNVIRSQLLKKHPEAIETFGYITKADREKLGLSKDHHMDASVIASCGRPFTFGSGVRLITKKCTRRHDYQKNKGVRSEQRINTRKICGFRKFDKVRYLGGEYFIKGRMSTGYAVLMDISGKKADFSHMPKGFKTPKLSNCTRLEARSSWMVMIEEAMLSIV